jgi:ribonuclease Z
MGENLMKIQVRPISKIGIDVSDNIIPLDQKYVLNQLNNDIKLNNLLDQARKEYKELLSKLPSNGCKDNITFLGTSGAASTKYRGESSILLHMFNFGYLLLDCGEGSYLQMCHSFGKQNANEIIANLKCIFISHKVKQNLTKKIQFY